MLTYGSFIADQLANSDGLESCRALGGLREALGKREARAAREAEEESPDPNKRQRKATKVFEAAPSHRDRALVSCCVGPIARGFGRESSLTTCRR